MLPVYRNLILTVIVLAGCQPKFEQNVQVTEEALIPTQEYLMAATLYVQHAAEYRALCYQAFEIAEWRLQEAIAKNPENSAVVLDLDETVLDNSAYSAWQVANDQPYSPESWELWTDMASAPEVPGAGDFLRMADSLGVSIFYISNRDTSALEPTMKNMMGLNLPQVEPDHFYLKSNTSDKSARRVAVEEKGYEIVLFIGDNLGDFHERWDKQSVETRAELADQFEEQFGEKYVVLPNPIYGTWEGAFYNYDWGLSDEQRDSTRHSMLEAAKITM